MKNANNRIRIWTGLVTVMLVVLLGPACDDLLSPGLSDAIKTDIDYRLTPERTLKISGVVNASLNHASTLTVKDGIGTEISLSPDATWFFLRWEKVSGDGTVSFADSSSPVTTASLSGGDAEIRPVLTIRPKIRYTTPIGAGIYCNTQISAVFSKDMDESTLTPANVRVLDQDDAVIAGTISYSNRQLTFKPDVSLASFSFHRVEINSNVKDTDGASLAEAFVGSVFKTGLGDDTIPPARTVDMPAMILNQGETHTTVTTVELNNLLAVDDSDVAAIWVSNSSDAFADPANPKGESFPFNKSIQIWQMTASQGQKHVYVWFVDGAGNKSASPYDLTIVLDQTPPAGTPSTSPYTNQTSVTLSPNFTDPLMSGAAGAGLDKIMIAQDQTFTQGNYNGSTYASPVWQNYSPSISGWKFDNTAQGSKTLWVKVKDKLGNESAPVQVNFTYDTTPPAGSINLAPDFTNQTSQTLAMTNTDNYQTDQMRLYGTALGISDPASAAWEAFDANKAISLAGSDGTKTITVQFRDAAGNISTAYSDSTQLDRVAPLAADATVSINNGATYAPAATSLTISAADDAGGAGIAEYALSQDADSFASPSWTPYTTGFQYTLTGSDASHTVFVRFRDKAGNVSAASVSDDIILDSTAPSITTCNLWGAVHTTYTNSTSVTLTQAASDSGSGSMEFRTNIDGGTWTSWTAYSSADQGITLPSTQGYHYINFQVRDGVGNSATGADYMYLDSSAPTASLVTDMTGTYSASYIRGSRTLTATPGSTVYAPVKQVDFYLDGAGTPFITDSSTPFTSALDTTALSDGTHTVVSKVTDLAGNTASTTTSYVVDNTAPTGTTNSLTYSGSTSTYLAKTQTWTASNPADATSGIWKVVYLVDGVAAGEDLTSPYQLSLNTTAYTAGSHNLAIIVYNKTGLSVMSGSVAYTVDNVAPSGVGLAVTWSGAYGGYLNGTQTMTATGTDANGIWTVGFMVDGVVQTWDSASAYNYTLNTTSFAEGSHTLNARIYDIAGNYTDVSGTYVFDNTAPVFTAIPSLDAGATSTDDVVVALTYSVSDTNFYWSWYGNDGDTVWTALSGLTAYSGNVTLRANSGARASYIKAVDKAGNYTISYDTIRYRMKYYLYLNSITFNGYNSQTDFTKLYWNVPVDGVDVFTRTKTQAYSGGSTITSLVLSSAAAWVDTSVTPNVTYAESAVPRQAGPYYRDLSIDSTLTFAGYLAEWDPVYLGKIMTSETSDISYLSGAVGLLALSSGTWQGPYTINTTSNGTKPWPGGISVKVLVNNAYAALGASPP